MSVYAVMECDKVVCLYRSPADACDQAKAFADKKEKEIRQKIGDDDSIEIERKENKIIIHDCLENDYEVINYWVKSMDVINKFKG